MTQKPRRTRPTQGWQSDNEWLACVMEREEPKVARQADGKPRGEKRATPRRRHYLKQSNPGIRWSHSFSHSTEVSNRKSFFCVHIYFHSSRPLKYWSARYAAMPSDDPPSHLTSLACSHRIGHKPTRCDLTIVALPLYNRPKTSFGGIAAKKKQKQKKDQNPWYLPKTPTCPEFHELPEP